MFHDELFAGKGPVTVWLNSPGGDCIAASQIYTMLMDYQGMTPAQAAAIPAVKDETPAQAGKTYDELMTRLNLIKP